MRRKREITLDTNTARDPSLSVRDYALIVLLGAIVFGCSLVSGKVLSMHESVLPQSSREMYLAGEWVIPTNGDRPWLERPPLPQWVTITAIHLFGDHRSEAAFRILPNLLGIVISLLTAGIAARLFGRRIGLYAGLILTTLFEFVRYAWLAEQDIFLATIVTLAVALFVKLEFTPERVADTRHSIFGTRSGLFLALFVVLGMTNLAKGLLFGTVMAVLPMAGFLLGTLSLVRIRRYFWIWGWLVFAAISVAWPIAAYQRYPGVLDLWFFDHVGRLSGEYTDINQPFWYYIATIPWVIAPWTPLAFLGIYWTRREALAVRTGPDRFVWCWAILPPLLFSFAGGKHHHYLLHSVAAWAILAAVATDKTLAWISQHQIALRPWKTGIAAFLPVTLFTVLWLGLAFDGIIIPGVELLFVGAGIVWPVFVISSAQALAHPTPPRLATTLFAGVASLYVFGYVMSAKHLDRGRHDAAFLKEVENNVPADAPIFAYNRIDCLEPFRMYFYLPKRTQPIHNATFLRDDRITASEVFVVSRADELEELQKLGPTEIVTQSDRSRRQKSEGDRFTLFKVTLPATMKRYANNAKVNPMQAMARQDGPYLGVENEPAVESTVKATEPNLK